MFDSINSNREFNWLRSKLYKEALQEYPKAREMDFEIMKTFLNPQKNETILEVWAWSGFFSWNIADNCKKLYVSDPSKDQLQEIKNLNKSNIRAIQWWAEELNLPENSIDSIWSFWAIHHCLNKTQAFQNFQKILKPWGKLIIVDVLSGSDLASHFDDKVAKYCISWHEVSFLSNEYFDSLCFSSWLKNIWNHDWDVKWKFKQEEDIWNFLYKLHAMTKTSVAECLQWAKDILWVTKNDLFYCLNRPLTVFIGEKNPVESIEQIPELESKNYKNGLPISCEKCWGNMTTIGNTCYESNPFTGITYYPSCTKCGYTITVTHDDDTWKPIIWIYDDND